MDKGSLFQLQDLLGRSQVTKAIVFAEEVFSRLSVKGM